MSGDVALSIPSESSNAIVFAVTDETIKKFEEYKSLRVKDIHDKAQLSAVHDARMELVRARTSVDKTRKAMNEQHQKQIDENNARAKKLLGTITPIEDALRAEEDRVEKELDEEREREKAAKLAQRKSNLSEIVGGYTDMLRAYPDDYLLSVSETVFNTLCKELPVTVSVRKAADEAAVERRKKEEEAAAEARRIEEQHRIALAAQQEEERKRQAEQAAELERQRQELERKRNELAEQERKQREEQEKAQREIEEQRLAVERERQEQERQRQQEEERRLAAIKAAEEAESRKQAELKLAEERRQREEQEKARIESLKPAVTRLSEWADAVRSYGLGEFGKLQLEGESAKIGERVIWQFEAAMSAIGCDLERSVSV